VNIQHIVYFHNFYQKLIYLKKSLTVILLNTAVLFVDYYIILYYIILTYITFKLFFIYLKWFCNVCRMRQLTKCLSRYNNISNIDLSISPVLKVYRITLFTIFHADLFAVYSKTKLVQLLYICICI